MKRAVAFLFSVFFILSVFSSYGGTLSSLLGRYTQLGDLSQKTKKESAGNVIVFTRADLDRMKVKSVGELIQYIPFIRYNEDENGLINITYAPYQYGTFVPIVVYLNDKEVYAPFFVSGMQILSGIDMDYIDHVEVYLGVPTYDIGIHSSLYVIKLYTKKGFRENSTVVGSYYGTYHTNNQYIYSGKGTENNNYFLYFDRSHLNRKRAHYTSPVGNTYTFSKNSDNYYFYGELDKGNLKLYGENLWASKDNYICQSWDLTTKRAHSYFNYLSGGGEYLSNDGTFKINAYYSYFVVKSDHKSEHPIGLVVSPPLILTYNNFYTKVWGDVLDTNVEKRLRLHNNELLLGFFGRYKHYHFDKYKTYIPYIKGNVDLYVPRFNKEYLYDFYMEEKYLINPRNLFVFSSKIERHMPNGGVRNFTLFGLKGGYIYNGNNITLKGFVAYKSNPISSYLLFRQKLDGESRVSPSRTLVYTVEANYKKGNSSYDVLLVRDENRKFIYFNGHYNNYDKDFALNGVSLTYKYNFDPFNKIVLNGWYVRADNVPALHEKLSDVKNLMGSMEGKDANFFGGYISLFNRFGNFSLFNSLSYRGIFNDNRPSFNLCSTITYNPKDRLTIYLKGINLLNRGVTTTYIAVNPLTGKVSTLNHVQPIDRTVWVGVEYSF